MEFRRVLFRSPAGTTAEVAATQVALARAQLAEIRAGSQTRAADTQVARAARAEAQIQAAQLGETLPLLDEQIAANEKLLEKGYVSKLTVIEKHGRASCRDKVCPYL